VLAWSKPGTLPHQITGNGKWNKKWFQRPIGINLLYISEIKKSNCIPASLSKSNLCLPSTKFTQMVCHFWEKKNMYTVLSALCPASATMISPKRIDRMV
jgi:hypothetical protein